MKIGVYAEGIWQAKKFNRKLGIGEDALPYVGKNMISVADGAGGRGAERADEINNELLNPERSFDVFLEECEMSSREAYRAQYNDNFSQLFELGEDYYAIGGRKSCYFGSRLATLFLRKIVEEDEFPEENIKEIFNRIDRMQMQDRDDYLVSLERRMAQKLQKLMHRAGKNGKLAPSQALKGSNYSFMSTTYSGICFYEEDNYVHVLSIQAGDSLAWGMIVEKDESTEQPRLALRQLQPGQENEAGGLLNSINVNDGFYLRCAYHKLEKPCGILVSSDGCFDAFETQIHFERFLMWQLMKANNTAEAEKSIQEFFCINRPNDDSSSLALCLFGFKDYGMVSEMANRRQNQLYREFEMENSALYSQDESPEFLEEDARFALRGCIAGFSGRLWEDSAALRDEVMSVVREKYPERLQAIKQKYEYALARLDISRQIEDQIVEILQRYWLDIRKAYIPVANENRPLFFRKNIYEMLDSRDQLKKKIIGIQTQVRIETARIKTLSDRSNCSEDIAFEDLKTTIIVTKKRGL